MSGKAQMQIGATDGDAEESLLLNIFEIDLNTSFTGDDNLKC